MAKRDEDEDEDEDEEVPGASDEAPPPAAGQRPPGYGPRANKSGAQPKVSAHGLALLSQAHADNIHVGIEEKKVAIYERRQLMEENREQRKEIAELHRTIADLLKVNASELAGANAMGVEEKRIAASSENIRTVATTLTSLAPFLADAVKSYTREHQSYAEGFNSAIVALFTAMNERKPEIIELMRIYCEPQVVALYLVMERFKKAKGGNGTNEDKAS